MTPNQPPAARSPPAFPKHGSSRPASHHRRGSPRLRFLTPPPPVGAPSPNDQCRPPQPRIWPPSSRLLVRRRTSSSPPAASFPPSALYSDTGQSVYELNAHLQVPPHEPSPASATGASSAASATPAALLLACRRPPPCPSVAIASCSPFRPASHLAAARPLQAGASPCVARHRSLCARLRRRSPLDRRCSTSSCRHMPSPIGLARC